MFFDKIGRIELIYFFIGLGIGMFIVYSMTPPPQVIIRHPNPNNLDTIYRDEKQDNKECYKYKAEEVKCPEDVSQIRDTPFMR